MIRVNDNYFSPKPAEDVASNENSPTISKKKDIENSLKLDIGTFRANKDSNTLFSFFTDLDKKTNKNDKDQLIVSIIKGGGDKFPAQIQTGNYIGKFCYEKVDFDIRSRFGDLFLQRILNFASDIYLDDVRLLGSKVEGSSFHYSRLIIYYLYIQSLEKAFLLGLPKTYQSVKHHESTVRGRIDINRFICHDIPFIGKISTISREQQELQPVIDVLAKAIQVMERGREDKGKKGEPAKDNAGRTILKRIANIRAHLYERKSNAYISNEVMHKAKQAKVLQNPIFTPYKKVLKYAEMIIKTSHIEENQQGKSENYGFLINVAELFEIYVTKLLQRAFIEWNVHSPKIELYDEENLFFARKIIPDIVMERGNDILIFDTKYKRMNYKTRYYEGGGDLDRADFFQINTYMSYYQQKGKNVICGGLLYPLSEGFTQEKCHSIHWLGNEATQFIVDGVELSETGDNFIDAEKLFIERIKGFINDHTTLPH